MELSDNPLYSDILTAWLNEHKMRIMESTAYNYFRAIPYVQQYFQGMHVKDIASEDIYEYVKCLKQSNLSITSTRLYCKVIQMSLNYAVKYHYIYYNPASDVSMPGRSRAEVRPFLESEIPLLLTTPGLKWVKDGIVIAYRTGMRPGEVYGLKWTDINFDQRFISVQRTISRANSKAILKSTKTAAGVRRIDIDSKLIAHLRAMQTETDGDFVFAGTQRSRYAYRVPWNVSRLLKEMCKRVGIPPRNFYSLRHTHATILLAHGVHPKIVQERLGHSSINITMEVYSHVAPTMQRDAVKVMEDIF